MKFKRNSCKVHQEDHNPTSDMHPNNRSLKPKFSLNFFLEMNGKDKRS